MKLDHQICADRFRQFIEIGGQSILTILRFAHPYRAQIDARSAVGEYHPGHDQQVVQTREHGGVTGEGVDSPLVVERQYIDSRNTRLVCRVVGRSPGDALVDIADTVAVAVGEDVHEPQLSRSRFPGYRPQHESFVPVKQIVRQAPDVRKLGLPFVQPEADHGT